MVSLSPLVFLFLLADQAGAAGQGLETTLVNTWPWPNWAALLLIIVTALCVIAIYLQEPVRGGWPLRGVLLSLRLTLAGLIVLMMYGWIQLRHRTDLPDLAIAIDVSGSMNREDYLDDRPQREAAERWLKSADLTGTSRLDLAKSVLLQQDGRLLEQLRQRYNVRLFEIGAAARPLGGGTDEWFQAVRALPANDAASRLGSGLLEMLDSLRGRPAIGVMLLTDGVTTDGRTLSEAAEDARRRAIPLFIVGLGSDQPPRDIRISELVVEPAAFVGDLLNFDFQLAADGYGGRVVQAALFREGQADALVQQDVRLPQPGATASVRLVYRPPEAGDVQFQVQVEPQEGEADVNNNRQTRRIQIKDETIRVLYVQEYPSFEFRFLKLLLSRGLKRGDGPSDKAFELTTVLQEADPQYADLDQTAQRVFPVSRDELFRYDVVLFGDVNPDYLSRSVLENLADFVIERGGGVVFLSGPRHTPLAYRDTPLEKLLPISLSSASQPAPGELLRDPFALQPTPLGLLSPPAQLGDDSSENLRLWRSLPGLYWLVGAAERKPGARVILEHATRVGSDGQHLPVVVLQFVGAGKVMLQLTDETYRWSKDPRGEQYYARYWIQTIRYLSRAKLLGAARTAELTADRREYRRGEPVRLQLRFLDERAAPTQDDGVTLVLQQEMGRRRSVPLQRDAVSRAVFAGTVDQLQEGRYRVWLAAPALEGPPPAEQFTVTAPPGEMARLEMDSADLQLAAHRSEGRFYTLRTATRLQRDLPPGRQVRIQALPPRSMWNSPILAAVFMATLIGEWLLRKKAGLL